MSDARKIDPQPACAFALVGDDHAAVLILHRAIYQQHEGEKYGAEIVPTAGYTVSWAMIEQMHAALGQALEQHRAPATTAAKSN